MHTILHQVHLSINTFLRVECLKTERKKRNEVTYRLSTSFTLEDQGKHRTQNIAENRLTELTINLNCCECGYCQKLEPKQKKNGMIFLLSFVRSFAHSFCFSFLFSCPNVCVCVFELRRVMRFFFSVAFCKYTYLATGSILSHCVKKTLKQLYIVGTLYRLFIAVSVARTYWTHDTQYSAARVNAIW